MTELMSEDLVLGAGAGAAVGALRIEHPYSGSGHASVGDLGVRASALPAARETVGGVGAGVEDHVHGHAAAAGAGKAGVVIRRTAAVPVAGRRRDCAGVHCPTSAD